MFKQLPKGSIINLLLGFRPNAKSWFLLSGPYRASFNGIGQTGRCYYYL